MDWSQPNQHAITTHRTDFFRTIEVPEMSLVATVLPIHELIISEPGAKMSTQEPKLDHDDRESRIVVAPTVTAEGERPGDFPHASFPSFPAATVTWTPASVSFFERSLS